MKMVEVDGATYTEAQILAALRLRHTEAGNGGAGRWAFLTHVRTGAAWGQQEIDAVAMALWPSDGHWVHAFEVKCSRSDWLREIRPDVSKSSSARSLCDTFTVVAPRGVVRRAKPGSMLPEEQVDELPEGWGLLEACKHVGIAGEVVTLRQLARPTLLHGKPSYFDNRTLPRTFVVAMMRATGAVPGMTSGVKRARVR